MRCKKHPSDLSCSVGVCASCLRERLFALIAAQAQAQAQVAQRPTLDDCCKSDPPPPPPPPPPLIFPRSVSPYVTRRKSDDTTTTTTTTNTNTNTTWPHHNQFDHRFYSTPQLGPTYNSSSSTFTTSRSYKKKQTKFSIFSNIFKSRSDKSNSNSNSNSDPRVPPRVSCDPTSSSSSPSWFSAIFPARRKKQSRLFSVEEAATAARRPCRRQDRGMSPERGADSDAECDRSPSGSGYSSESSQGWKRTPVVRRTRTAQNRNASGLAFCLSPLVRASPNRHWNQKNGLTPDKGFSGEIRGTVKPHLATAASYCANRSRKLVDFGRVNPNR